MKSIVEIQTESATGSHGYTNQVRLRGLGYYGGS